MLNFLFQIAGAGGRGQRLLAIPRRSPHLGPDYNLLISRLALASVWLHKGLWLELLAAIYHAHLVAAVPLGGPWLFHGIGLAEFALAAWILTGRHPRLAAYAQTALLLAMNAGGLLFARHLIADPVAMLTQNAVLLALAWRIAL